MLKKGKFERVVEGRQEQRDEEARGEMKRGERGRRVQDDVMCNSFGCHVNCWFLRAPWDLESG